MADYSGQWCTQMPTCLSRSIQMIANEWPAAGSSVFRDGCGVYTLYSLVYQLQGCCAWVKFVFPPFVGDTESLALVIARFCAFLPILVAIVGKMESHRISLRYTALAENWRECLETQISAAFSFLGLPKQATLQPTWSGWPMPPSCLIAKYTELYFSILSYCTKQNKAKQTHGDSSILWRVVCISQSERKMTEVFVPSQMPSHNLGVKKPICSLRRTKDHQSWCLE